MKERMGENNVIIFLCMSLLAIWQVCAGKKRCIWNDPRGMQLTSQNIIVQQQRQTKICHKKLSHMQIYENLKNSSF